ncbi:MAG: hypothetical protein Q8850_02845, partial [Candidatus Phytoplasma australasiaticum]|nr:hypothetical protein [Candidatus Phytoplasma australasiaticum]
YARPHIQKAISETIRKINGYYGRLIDKIDQVIAYLRAYCDQLIGVGKNKALLMRPFSRSLSGEAWNGLLPKKWTNRLVGVLWPRILLRDSLTISTLFPIDIPWKK